MVTFKEGSSRFTYRVGAVALRQGHVLLMRSVGEDVWFVSGGRVELGETAKDAVAREWLPARQAMKIRVVEALRTKKRLTVESSLLDSLKPNGYRRHGGVRPMCDAKWATGAIAGIDHINIRIDPGPEALERAKDFYGTVLRMTPIERPENVESRDPGAWYKCGSNEVHITAESGASERNRATRRHAAFLVRGLEELRVRMEKAGAEIIPGTVLPGRRRFFARDPFGNRLEFMEPED
jgi:catechol 2,3-dioxygenase-like lactoylglutathione lyase family enzyme